MTRLKELQQFQQRERAKRKTVRQLLRYTLPDRTRALIALAQDIDTEVKAFARKTKAAEYTDTGEVLELLHSFRRQARKALR